MQGIEDIKKANDAAVDMLTVHVALKPDVVENLCCIAFEGGANYWLKTADYTGEWKKPIGDNLVWWGFSEVFTRARFQAELGYDDPDAEEFNVETNTKKKQITYADLERGLNLMAEKCPIKFAEAVMGDADADTADVFMQFVVFGDVVYG